MFLNDQGDLLVTQKDDGRVILAHPNLDLYVGLDSKHSYEKVGCTSCHDGSGQETDFVLTAHTARDIWVDQKTGAAVLPEQIENAPDGIALGGFEWIRSHRGALVGVQILPDGSRHVVRLQLNRGGAVTEAIAIDAFLPRDAGPTFATVSGDDLYYLVTQQGNAPTTPGGNVMHVEMGLDSMFLYRPLPELAGYRTPVRGLFLTGASTLVESFGSCRYRVTRPEPRSIRASPLSIMAT